MSKVWCEHILWDGSHWIYKRLNGEIIKLRNYSNLKCPICGKTKPKETP